MTYNPNIPLSTDLLSTSQGDLLTNFTQLDTVFDQDHYKYSDSTPSLRGKHKVITLPPEASKPSTAANEVKVYSQEETTALGPLLYARGESDAVTSPLSRLQGAFPVVVNATSQINILDFTGITRAMCEFTFVDTVQVLTSYSRFMITFASGAFTIRKMSLEGAATVTLMTNSGNTLQLQNPSGVNFTSGMWTLEFLRIEI